MDHGDGAVGAVDGAQEGEGDGVVSAEGDDAGEGLPLDPGAAFVGVGGGGAGEDLKVAFLDLFECVGVVVSWVCVSVCRHLHGRRGSYEVTGMSPQSRTVAQLLKGFVLRGTL